MYVPIVSESGTANAIYTVTLERDNRISNIDYNGLLIDGKTPVPTSLAKQLRGDEVESGDYMQGGELGNNESGGPGAEGNNGVEENKPGGETGENGEKLKKRESRGEAGDKGADENAESFSDYDARKDNFVPAPGT